MIRINLVAEGKKPVVARQQSSGGGLSLLDGENVALYALLAGLLIFLAVFGVWWYQLSSEAKATQAIVRTKEKRVAELRDIINQVEEFERRQELLQQKIDVITELKNNQRGPVEIMDQISRALPELLWVDRLEQTGQNIVITGRAFNISAVSTFIENLDDAPAFQEPVLRDTKKSNADVWTYAIQLQKVVVAPPSNDSAAAAG